MASFARRISRCASSKRNLYSVSSSFARETSAWASIVASCCRRSFRKTSATRRSASSARRVSLSSRSVVIASAVRSPREPWCSRGMRCASSFCCTSGSVLSPLSRSPRTRGGGWREPEAEEEEEEEEDRRDLD